MQAADQCLNRLLVGVDHLKIYHARWSFTACWPCAGSNFNVQCSEKHTGSGVLLTGLFQPAIDHLPLVFQWQNFALSAPSHSTIDRMCMQFEKPCAGARMESISISGLVVEYIVAIDVTRVRFPVDAFWCSHGQSIRKEIDAYSLVCNVVSVCV